MNDPVQCDPGDHDETGERTEQHEMDLIPVHRILERAQREGWPTSYINAMSNHHLCGTLPGRNTVSKPTEEELAQLRAAAVEKAKQGDDQGAARILAVYDLVTGADPGPEAD